MIQAHRPRRNRKNQAIRDLVAETSIEVGNLIYPVFVSEGSNLEQPIQLMPGQSRLSADILSKKIHAWKKLGLKHYALFPQIPDSKKDSRGSECLNENGLLPETLKRLKDDHPEITIITDVALDPFSSDGHDGLVIDGKIVNDDSVKVLTEMAVKQAAWGADWVAPSDMMDGRIGAIRKALDESGFLETNILAYSAKYASSFYGPFRDALQSAPKFGDKKTYQMDPRNINEALREVQLDIDEGADMVMIKPGLPYLDVISRIKEISSVPVAAYNVSGEYTMIKLAAKAGAIDEKRAIIETMISFRRAGANAILTYFAPEMAEILSQQD
jgi:porphobilinogen synthase